MYQNVKRKFETTVYTRWTHCFVAFSLPLPASLFKARFSVLFNSTKTCSTLLTLKCGEASLTCISVIIKINLDTALCDWPQGQKNNQWIIGVLFLESPEFLFPEIQSFEFIERTQVLRPVMKAEDRWWSYHHATSKATFYYYVVSVLYFRIKGKGRANLWTGRHQDPLPNMGRLFQVSFIYGLFWLILTKCNPWTHLTNKTVVKYNVVLKANVFFLQIIWMILS